MERDVGKRAAITGQPRGAPLSLDGEEFLSWLAVERGRAVNTLAAYRRDLRAYEVWLSQRGVGLMQVSEADVLGYVAQLWSTGRAPSSVARALVAVRSLHRFLVDEGHAGSDPTGDVGSPKVPQGLPKALTEDEVGSLLGAVVGEDATARRDRLILELLYGTGMRISELVGLSIADLALSDPALSDLALSDPALSDPAFLDLAVPAAAGGDPAPGDLGESGIIRVFGKGSKERLVPVGRYARTALDEWLCFSGRGAMTPARWAHRGDSEALLLNARGGRLSRQGAWGIVRRYGDKVGLGERLTPHVLRHSCATHMLDHGADIRVVQELLGHASISTTQVYTRVSTERLRSAYQAAHPRARRQKPTPEASGR